MSTSRNRPVWPAYLVASAALFVALDGPAHAAALVTGAGIKDGTITSVDVKNGSLTGTDVRDGTLGGADVRDSSLRSVDVANGTLGVADLSTAARASLADVGACPAGQELRWLKVNLLSDSAVVDDTLRVGRCLGTGETLVGDGIVQGTEECDPAMGGACNEDGTLPGAPGLALPTSELQYVP